MPKDVRLNSTHFSIINIPNKRQLQQITINHLSDVDFKDFMKIYKKCTARSFFVFWLMMQLPSDNPLRFKRNFLE